MLRGWFYMWCRQVIASLYMVVEALDELVTKLPEPRWSRETIFMAAYFFPDEGQGTEVGKRPNKKHMGHIIGKSLYGCLSTCGGWPTWPVQGSLMLQISQVRVSPILQKRESDVGLLCMQWNVVEGEDVMF